jgi:CheY-like chemotaxis protein
MKKRNILLVDDDQIFNLLNHKTLQMLGAVGEIHTARNGKEALDLINDYYIGSRALPEVILLDLNMPIMDGFGFIEAFHRLNIPNISKTLIIIVTSSNNPNDIRRARELGITNYLTKPVSEVDLREALAEHV